MLLYSAAPVLLRVIDDKWFVTLATTVWHVGPAWLNPLWSVLVQALHLLNHYRDDSATHNCWAFRCGNDFRTADDGEPSGTAGKPILGAIEGEGLDYVMVLVVR